jgi:hypothetical protein
MGWFFAEQAGLYQSPHGMDVANAAREREVKKGQEKSSAFRHPQA